MDDDDALAEVRRKMTPEERLLLAVYENEQPPAEVRQRALDLYGEQSTHAGGDADAVI